MGDGGDGFEEAFPELVLPAFRVALRILGDVAEAEDIAAEALARALQSWAVTTLRTRLGADWQETDLALD